MLRRIRSGLELPSRRKRAYRSGTEDGNDAVGTQGAFNLTDAAPTGVT
jgi:hypothetical protein